MELNIFGSPISETIWVPFVAAVIGGALSLSGTVLANVLANRSARLAREDEAERLFAERAIRTFFRLLDEYNKMYSLKRHIDQMFDAHAHSSTRDMEPWAKVKQIVGTERSVEVIDPSETYFLITDKKADLLNEVHLIQRRAASIFAAAEKYHELRAELEAFLLANSSATSLSEGTVLKSSLEEPLKSQADAMSGQLNSLIGQIMDALDKDIPSSWATLTEFKEAARARFGEKFLEFDLKTYEF